MSTATTPAETWRERLTREASEFETRASTWPTWKKLAVFTPVLVAGTAVVMAILAGINAVVHLAL